MKITDNRETNYKMTSKKKIVIVSDLDGSLLDSRTYLFEKALPALKIIKKRNIPLVLSSSKTRSEITLYRKKLKNNDPFVTENGGGVFIPEGHFPFTVGGKKRDGYHCIAFGRPYKEVRKTLNNLKRTLYTNVRGFGDMTIKEIATLTGISEGEASLAKEREFDEPFVFTNQKKSTNSFLTAIEKRGYTWTQGRIFHILGNHNKGKAAQILFKLYSRFFNSDIITIGIGDGLNDLPLLEVVDYPVLLPDSKGDYPNEIKLEGLTKGTVSGPEGWNASLLELLDKV